MTDRKICAIYCSLDEHLLPISLRSGQKDTATYHFHQFYNRALFSVAKIRSTRIDC